MNGIQPSVGGGTKIPKHFSFWIVVKQVPLPAVGLVTAVPRQETGKSGEKTAATSSADSRNQPQQQKKDQKQTSKGLNSL